MKKFGFITLVAFLGLFLLCSCGGSGSKSGGGGKKEKAMAFCKQFADVYNEAIDRMRCSENADEFLMVREVYEKRIDRIGEEAERAIGEDELEELYENDAQFAKAVDEMKILESKYWGVKYEMERKVESKENSRDEWGNLWE